VPKKPSGNADRYTELLVDIFRRHRSGWNAFEFRREEIVEIAAQRGIKLPKNLGDLIYTFRFRKDQPEEIAETAKDGYEWVIQLAGVAKYRMVHRKAIRFEPNESLKVIDIPDATPEIVTANALNDEQALLAKVRYNRLIDIFLRVAAYSLQNHLRTTVANVGQIETDEIYVAVTNDGRQFVVPVQAKVERDRIGAVQVEQDLAMCRDKYPKLTPRPVAVQSVVRDGHEVIVLFELVEQSGDIRIEDEKHYRLVRRAE
jgi:hypothetical protein